jgi:AhpD family alkylhydroperoxidase
MQVTLGKQARSGIAVRWLVLLCLLLVSIAATAQVLHVHPEQAADAPTHCALCLVMHSAAAVAHSVQLDFSLQTAAFLTASLDSQRPSVVNSFALFSRPPPLA